MTLITLSFLWVLIMTITFNEIIGQEIKCEFSTTCPSTRFRCKRNICVDSDPALTAVEKAESATSTFAKEAEAYVKITLVRYADFAEFSSVPVVEVAKNAFFDAIRIADAAKDNAKIVTQAKFALVERRYRFEYRWNPLKTAVNTTPEYFGITAAVLTELTAVAAEGAADRLNRALQQPAGSPKRKEEALLAAAGAVNLTAIARAAANATAEAYFKIAYRFIGSMEGSKKVTLEDVEEAIKEIVGTIVDVHNVTTFDAATYAAQGYINHVNAINITLNNNTDSKLMELIDYRLIFYICVNTAETAQNAALAASTVAASFSTGPEKDAAEINAFIADIVAQCAIDSANAAAIVDKKIVEFEYYKIPIKCTNSSDCPSTDYYCSLDTCQVPLALKAAKVNEVTPAANKAYVLAEIAVNAAEDAYEIFKDNHNGATKEIIENARKVAIATKEAAKRVAYVLAKAVYNSEYYAGCAHCGYIFYTCRRGSICRDKSKRCYDKFCEGLIGA